MRNDLLHVVAWFCFTSLLGCGQGQTVVGAVADSLSSVDADASVEAGDVPSSDSELALDATATDDADVATQIDVVPDATGGSDDSGTEPDTVTQCQDYTGCPATTPFCVAGKCTVCELDYHCPESGARCVQGACAPAQPCITDKQCGNFNAVCDESAGVCRECMADTDCAVGSACSGNVCTPKVSCQSSKQCPDDLVCAGGYCVACGADAECPTSYYCSAGLCLQDVCTPGTSCQDGQQVVCTANGSEAVTTECEPGSACITNACEKLVCPPDSSTCSGQDQLLCNEDGTKQTVVPCGSGKTCSGGVCIDKLCTPKATACSGSQLQTCNDAGTAWQQTSCDDGDACTADGCTIVTAACSHAPVACDDNNPCTIDGCNGGCSFVPVAAGTPCTDGSNCNATNLCQNGSCVAPAGAIVVGTSAGSGTAGATDGAATSATFNQPMAVSYDPTGNLIVADSLSHRIRTVSSANAVGTLFGTTAGSGATQLNTPVDLARHNNDLYIADQGNHRIMRWSFVTNSSSVFKGSSAGSSDGKDPKFNAPTGVAVDSGGNVWVADRGNHTVRRIDLKSGYTSTIAGVSGAAGYVDGPAATAKFNQPCKLAFLSDGTLVVGDCGNGRLRKISADGSAVSTWSGSGPGFQDGAATSAKFGAFGGLAVRGQILWLSDADNRRIRTVSQDGSAATIAGSGTAGFLDGAATSAQFGLLGGFVVTNSGQVLLADAGNNRIRTLTMAELVCNDSNPCTTDSCSGATCQFLAAAASSPCSDGNACTTDDKCMDGVCTGLAVATCTDDQACVTNSCNVWTGGCNVVNLDGPCNDNDACTSGDGCLEGKCQGSSGANEYEVITVAGKSKENLTLDGVGSQARFYAARHAVLAKDGGLIISEEVGQVLRYLSIAGMVDTIAGTGAVGNSDGAALQASFTSPLGLAMQNDAVYIADRNNNSIRVLNAGELSTLVDSTSGLKNPRGLAFLTDGTLLVADRDNYRIVSVSPAGVVSNWAGTGVKGSDNGQALQAKFSRPSHICVDPNNSAVYVTDDHSIRRIFQGEVTTWAGSISSGYSDGKSGSAKFHNPYDCAVSTDGSVWVADTYNHRIRKIDLDQNVTTVAGSGAFGSSVAILAVDGPATTATFEAPSGIVLGQQGKIWVIDFSVIRLLTPKGLSCNDGNTCTNDGCNKTTGSCTNVAAQAGAPCSDGSACTASDTCVGQQCTAGSAMSCDDGDACTIDSCTAAVGCVHEPSAAKACCTAVPLQLDFASANDDIGQWAISNTPNGWLKVGTGGTKGDAAIEITPKNGVVDILSLTPAAPVVADNTSLVFSYRYFNPGANVPKAHEAVSLEVLVDGVVKFTVAAAPQNGTWTQATVALTKKAIVPPTIEIRAKGLNANAPLVTVTVDALTVKQTCQF